MSRGKYSPNLPQGKQYIFNARGKIPEDYLQSSDYNEETMTDCYDSEGFDRYGYSAYDEDGKYVGIGDGVDRNGYTEMDYLRMSEEEFQKFC